MGHPLGTGSGPSEGVFRGIPGVLKVFQGCSEGVPGVFRDVSGLFRVFPLGIFIYIFKFPFSWCKVKLENKSSPHDCYSL